MSFDYENKSGFHRIFDISCTIPIFIDHRSEWHREIFNIIPELRLLLPKWDRSLSLNLFLHRSKDCILELVSGCPIKRIDMVIQYTHSTDIDSDSKNLWLSLLLWPIRADKCATKENPDENPKAPYFREWNPPITSVGCCGGINRDRKKL